MASLQENNDSLSAGDEMDAEDTEVAQAGRTDRNPGSASRMESKQDRIRTPELQSVSYLEKMVAKPTWKELLLDLIASESVDPWNIDLHILSDSFLKRVKKMETMDFVVPANVILAAAILLKYKSNYLKFLNYQSEIPEFIPDSVGPDAGSEALPSLTLSSRIPPRRQVTLDELLGEMERIIKYDTTERVKIPRGGISEMVDLELPEHNIEQDMVEVLTKIKKETDAEGWSLFSRVTNGCSLQQLVYTLLCILYLVQDGVLDIRQDENFGEIFIKMLG